MDVQKTKRPVKANKANSKTKSVISKPAYKNTEARLRILLESYAGHGRLLRACEAAGIGFNVHYRRLQSDPVYRAAFEEAEQAVAQSLEDKVHDWAMEDDLQAAVVLLKRFRPQLYRDRASIDVTGEISISEALTEARSRVIELERNDRTGTQG